MNYPTTYIQQYLASIFEKWIENLDKNSLNISLWEGYVELSNLTFKRNQIFITNDLQATLEYGSSQFFSLNAPWSKLRSGDISVFADDVQLILRIHSTLDNLAASCCHMDENTSNKSTNALMTWMTDTVNNFLVKWLSNIVGCASATFSNLQVFILIPTDVESNSLLQLKLCLSSLSVSNAVGNTEKSSDDQIRFTLNGFNKVIQLKNFNFGISEIPCPTSPCEYSSLTTSKSSMIILNPLQIEINLYISSFSQLFFSSGQNKESRTNVRLKVSVENFDVCVRLSHIQMIHDAINSLEYIVADVKRARERYLEALRCQGNDFIKPEECEQKQSEIVNVSKPPNPLLDCFCEVVVVIKRIAITVAEDADDFKESLENKPQENRFFYFQAKQSKNNHSVKRLMMIAVYGVKFDCMSSSQTDLRLLIGSIKFFGVNGIEVLSIGGNPDDWLEVISTVSLTHHSNGSFTFGDTSLQCALIFTSIAVALIESPPITRTFDGVIKVAEDKHMSSRYREADVNNELSDDASESMESANGDVFDALSSLTCIIDSIHLQIHFETITQLRILLEQLQQLMLLDYSPLAESANQNLQDSEGVTQLIPVGNSKCSRRFQNIYIGCEGMCVVLPFPSDVSNRSAAFSDKSSHSSGAAQDCNWVVFSVSNVNFLAGSSMNKFYCGANQTNNIDFSTVSKPRSLYDTWLSQKRSSDKINSVDTEEASTKSRMKTLILQLESKTSDVFLVEVKGVDISILKQKPKKLPISDLCINFAKEKSVSGLSLQRPNVSPLFSQCWFFSIVLSLSNDDLSFFANSSSDIRMDMYASPFEIIARSEEFLSITDLLHKVFVRSDVNGAKLTRGEIPIGSKKDVQNKKSVDVNQAINRSFHFHIHIESVSLSVHSKFYSSLESVSSIVQSSLLNWTRNLLVEGENSTNLTRRKLIEQRLLKLGFVPEAVHELFNSIFHVASTRKRDVKGIESEVVSLWQRYGETRGNFLPHVLPLCRIMFEDCFIRFAQGSCGSSLELLMHDGFICDHSSLPIIHVGARKMSEISSKNEFSSTKSSSKKHFRRRTTLKSEGAFNAARKTLSINSSPTSQQKTSRHRSATNANGYSLVEDKESRNDRNVKHLPGDRRLNAEGDVTSRRKRKESNRILCSFPLYVNSIDDIDEFTVGLELSFLASIDKLSDSVDRNQVNINRSSVSESRGVKVNFTIKHLDVIAVSESVLLMVKSVLDEYSAIRSRLSMLDMFYHVQRMHQGRQDPSEIFNTHEYMKHSDAKSLGKGSSIEYRNVRHRHHMKRSSRHVHNEILSDLHQSNDNHDYCKSITFEYSVSVAVRKSSILIAVDEETYLLNSKLSRITLDFDASHASEPCDEHVSPFKVNYGLILISSVNICDLTPLGLMHHQIMWHRRCPSDNPEITVEFSFSADSLLKVQCFLENMSILLIVRFWTELSRFISDFVVKKIILLWKESMIQLNMKIQEINDKIKTLTVSVVSNETTTIGKFPGIQNFLDNLEDSDLESMHGEDDDNAESVSSSDYDSNQSSTSSNDSNLYDVRVRSRAKDASKLNLSRNYSMNFVSPKQSKDRLPLKKVVLPDDSHQKIKTKIDELESKSSSKPLTIQLCMALVDVYVFVPRNSTSLDVLAVHVGYGSVCNMLPSSTWKLPDGVVHVPSSKSPLHFNLRRNEWNHFLSEDFDDSTDVAQESDFKSWRKLIHRHPNNRMHLNSADIDSMSDEWDHPSQCSDDIRDGRDFRGMDNIKDGRDHISRRTVEFTVFPNPTYCWFDKSERNQDVADPVLSRVTVTLNAVDGFITITHDPTELAELDRKHLFMNEVVDGNVAFIAKARRDKLDKSTHRSSVLSQVWRKLSLDTFGVQLVLDITDKSVRLLIGDVKTLAKRNAGLNVRMSMGEFYALLSAVWFDNFFEIPQTFEIPSPTISQPAVFESVEGPVVENHHNADQNKSFQSLPRYGSREYWQRLREAASYFDLGIVFHAASYECSMETNYFVKAPYSLKLLTRPLVDAQNITETTKSTPIPFALLHATGFVLKLQVDSDAVQIAIGGGSADIYDIRMPEKTAVSLALQVPTRVLSSSRLKWDKSSLEQQFRNLLMEPINYGFSSCDFGLTINPSWLSSGSYDPSIPIQYSFHLSASSYWKSNNIGIESADLTLDNLDLIFMIRDYFSCYFRFEEFGNPSIESYNLLDKSSLPYGGLDTRLFLYRPLFVLLECTAGLPSQVCSIDVDKGVFYRYVLDSFDSVRSELRLYDSSAVLSKSYLSPEKLRGCRGSAGSGRSIRTLFEGLNCNISYHFDALQTISDFSIYLGKYDIDNVEDADLASNDMETKSNPKRVKAFDRINTSAHAYVDFEEENLKVNEVPISYPLTLRAMQDTDSSYAFESCDLVTSYEDLVVISTIIKTIFDVEPEDADEAQTQSYSPSSPSSRKTSWEAYAKDGDDSPRSTASFRLRRHRSTSEEFFQAAASTSVTSPDLPYDIFACISISAIRLILVDNVLGLHLPLFQAYLPKVDVNMEYSAAVAAMDKKSQNQVSRRSTFKENSMVENNVASISPLEKKSTYVYGIFTLWADCFNNIKKCWEPLLERLDTIVLYERGPVRGQGITIRTASNIHVNITGAFIRSIGDTMKMIHNTLSAHIEKEKSKDLKARNSSESMINMDKKDESELEKGIEQELAPRKVTPDIRRALSNISLSSFDDFTTKSKSISIHDSFNRKSNRKRRSGPNVSYGIIDRDDSNGFLHSRSIYHTPSQNLGKDVRVGFSLQNMTGQPIRYLQHWIDDRWRVLYLNHRDRGLLNFVASSTLIRNNGLVEETFNVQAISENDHLRSRSRKRRVGHEVALQVCGYDWLRSVQADVLSVKFHDLVPILGRRRNLSTTALDWKIANSLKLVTEVIPHNGGRLLRLRSVFSFKNNTSHSIDLLAEEGLGDTNRNNSNHDYDSGCPFHLAAGEMFYVPIALLHRSASMSKQLSLGRFYMRPSDYKPIEDELGSRLQSQIAHVDYSLQYVDLLEVVERTAEILSQIQIEDGVAVHGRDIADSLLNEICCYMHAKTKRWRDTTHQMKPSGAETHEKFESEHDSPSRLPPFCYNIEIQRVGTMIQAKKSSNRVSQIQAKFNGLFHGKDEDRPFEPIHYVIIVHPPIILENLLPIGGVFEIVHAKQQKRVLWSAWIDPGRALPIHTVTLAEPLLLLIHLKYCRTPDGVIIHQPLRQTGGSFAGKLQKTLEGVFLDDGFSDDASTVLLTDTVGQRLVLNIDNTEGKAGQRHITIYCPYWIVNTCQYTIRIREEGNRNLPAGSVTAQLDGSKPVPMANNYFQRERLKKESNDDFPSFELFGSGTIYPGTKGVLHSSNATEFAYDTQLHTRLANLTFEDIVNSAFMFNFSNNMSGFIGNRRVSFQLDDSEWSRSYSLDTVGVNQMVSVDDLHSSVYEVGFKIKAAQGRLGKYTKIVRFVPKFLIINKLDNDLQFYQPVSLSVSDSVIKVSAGHIKPFHLPDKSGERKLALQVDGLWTQTVPFDIDQIGSNTLMVKRSLKLASLRHVNTRGAPEYTVHFPPVEIGLWLETDWGENPNTVVKRLVSGLYAAKNTDIQVGDVLLKIDGERMKGKPFALVMLTLKNKLKEPGGCDVTFRTVEEKTRKIRSDFFSRNSPQFKDLNDTDSVIADQIEDSPFSPMSSSRSFKLQRHASMSSNRSDDRTPDRQFMRQRSLSAIRLPKSRSNTTTRSIRPEGANAYKAPSLESVFGAVDVEERDDDDDRDLFMPVRIDVKNSESCTVIVVRPVNPASESEYRIDNMSVSHIIHYKQKGVPGAWSSLGPGYSASFFWEDPFKPHRLLVVAGRNVTCPEEERDSEIFKLLGNDLTSTATIGFSFISGVATESSVVEIPFDEIGQNKLLPLFRTEAKLHVEVKSQGPSKTLVISPERRYLKDELKFTTSLIKKQVDVLEDKSIRFKGLVNIISTNRAFGKIEDVMSVNERSMLDELSAFQKQLISEFNSRSQKYGDLRDFMGDNESATPPTPLDSNLLSSAAVYIAPKLTAYAPLESVLGFHIRKQHQLQVDILKAKDLQPFVVGKLEDVYCKVYLRTVHSSIGSRKFDQPYFTYVCTQTLNPTWTGQRFIFDIPECVAEDARGFSIRVAVKSKTVVQLNRFLGQTDIHFAGLKNEDEVEGWFPLQPETSSFKTTVTTGIITGSIKLRLQYIHSNAGLAKYVLKVYEKRISELRSYYEIQFAMLYKLRKSKQHSLGSHKREIQNLNPLMIASEGLQSIGYGIISGAVSMTSNTKNGVISTFKNASEYTRKSIQIASDMVMGKEEEELSGNDSDDNALNNQLKTHDMQMNRVETDIFQGRGRSQTAAPRLSELSSSMKDGKPLTASPKSRRVFLSEKTTVLDACKPSDEELSSTNGIKKLTLQTPTTRNRRKSIHDLNLRVWASTLGEFQRVKRAEDAAPFMDRNELIKQTNHHDSTADSNDSSFIASEVMKRSMATQRANEAFTFRCIDELRRSYAHVHLTSGSLTITPMQVLHLSDTKRHLAVKITYGDQVHSTFFIPPAADLSWYQEEKADVFHHDTAADPSNSHDVGGKLRTSMRGSSHQDGRALKRDYASTLNESLAKDISIDTLNIRGSINIRVITDDVLKSNTIAQLNIPVLSLLDCLCLPHENGEAEVYDRWFPMIKKEELSSEGGFGESAKLSSEKTHFHFFGHGRPCIRLRLSWRNDKIIDEWQEPTIRRVARTTGETKNQFLRSNADQENFVRNNPSWKMYARFQFPLISVSLIDSAKSKEVVHISVTEIDCRHYDADKFTDTMGNITWFQVDNQLPDSSAAVIVSPTQVKMHQPIIRMRFRRNNSLSKKDITSYDTIELIIQEMDLRLEQQTVLAIWDLYRFLLAEVRSSLISSSGKNSLTEEGRKGIDFLGFATSNGQSSSPSDLFTGLNLLLSGGKGSSKSSKQSGVKVDNLKTTPNKTTSADIPKIVVDELRFDIAENDKNHSVYIENLFIGPIQINVSFLTTHSIISSRVDDTTISDAGSSETAITVSEGLGIASTFFMFFRQVGEVALNLTSSISDAPLFFAGYSVPHLLKTERELTQTLLDHYLLSALGQLYKIVGSLDLVGNPLALIQSLGIGVKDFFYEPAHALITNPNDIRKIGRSFVKGTISILSNTADGMIGTGTTITRSIGRNVAKLTMDTAYLRAREELQKPAQGVREALKRPVKDVINGVYSGVVGLVKVPYNETRRYGVGGFLMGLPKGAIGAATKPLVGVLDAVTHTGDAIREVVKATNKQKKSKPISRTRLSALFGPDGRLLPYHRRNALGSFILHILNRDVYFDRIEQPKSNSFEDFDANEPEQPMSPRFAASMRKISPSKATTQESSPLSFATAFRRRSRPEIIRDDEIYGRESMQALELVRSAIILPDRKTETYREEVSDNAGIDHDSLCEGYNQHNDAKETLPSKSLVLRNDLRSRLLSSPSFKFHHPRTREDAASNELAFSPKTQPKQILSPKIDNQYTEQSEFVVFTAIIDEGSGSDIVIILTTSRLIVVNYVRKVKRSAAVKLIWESNLDSLASPNFDLRGGKVALTLSLKGVLGNESHPRGRRDDHERRVLFGVYGKASHLKENSGAMNDEPAAENSFTIEADYQYEDVLGVLYNCIIAVGGLKEEFRHLGTAGGLGENYYDDFVEDDSNIVHIGPWQYSSDPISCSSKSLRLSTDQSSKNHEEQEIHDLLEELAFSRWVVDVEGSSSRFNPDTDSHNEHQHGERREDAITNDRKLTHLSPDRHKISKEDGDLANKDAINLPDWLLAEYKDIYSAHDGLVKLKEAMAQAKRTGTSLSRLTLRKLEKREIDADEFYSILHQEAALSLLGKESSIDISPKDDSSIVTKLSNESEARKQLDRSQSKSSSILHVFKSKSQLLSQRPSTDTNLIGSTSLYDHSVTGLNAQQLIAERKSTGLLSLISPDMLRSRHLPSHSNTPLAIPRSAYESVAASERSSHISDAAVEFVRSNSPPISIQEDKRRISLQSQPSQREEVGSYLSPILMLGSLRGLFSSTSTDKLVKSINEPSVEKGYMESTSNLMQVLESPEDSLSVLRSAHRIDSNALRNRSIDSHNVDDDNSPSLLTKNANLFDEEMNEIRSSDVADVTVTPDVKHDTIIDPVQTESERFDSLHRHDIETDDDSVEVTGKPTVTSGDLKTTDHTARMSNSNIQSSLMDPLTKPTSTSNHSNESTERNAYDQPREQSINDYFDDSRQPKINTSQLNTDVSAGSTKEVAIMPGVVSIESNMRQFVEASHGAMSTSILDLPRQFASEVQENDRVINSRLDYGSPSLTNTDRGTFIAHYDSEDEKESAASSDASSAEGYRRFRAYYQQGLLAQLKCGLNDDNDFDEKQFEDEKSENDYEDEEDDSQEYEDDVEQFITVSPNHELYDVYPRDSDSEDVKWEPSLNRRR